VDFLQFSVGINSWLDIAEGLLAYAFSRWVASGNPPNQNPRPINLHSYNAPMTQVNIKCDFSHRIGFPYGSQFCCVIDVTHSHEWDAMSAETAPPPILSNVRKIRCVFFRRRSRRKNTPLFFLRPPEAASKRTSYFEHVTKSLLGIWVSREKSSIF